ncbi:MAG: helix-turn-helix transcriptional regulator [Kineosporiaceae bacterium]|nr:helix-turn-helix transcriptional regulator [Kineosporiaceae bacterium]MBK7622159.1 helix-turn-helix transcriptional regulator [Kineosporiaceae bacterium]MBK8074470.1 helix-turn-helix transcriptional regulator [Kineosporiaceae bacterium]
MFRPSGAPSLGAIIRRQRELASLSMRALADTVGISNPYLSQIERDLRAPSEAVLSAIAETLQTTADDLYTQAGFVAADDEEKAPGSLLAAIEDATELSSAQRKALIEIYRAFLAANTVRRRREPS